MKIKLLSILLLLGLIASAQNPNKHIRQGNTAFSDSSYTDAENNYRQALSADQNSFDASFNLADAIYKQEKYSESSTLFNALTEKAKTDKERAMAYHNLGNSLLKEQKLEESINAYKNALRNNPIDPETKHNLAYAQRMKQQEKEEEQKDDQQEEKKENEEKKEDKEDKEDKEEQEKEDQKEQNNQESDENKKPEKPQDPNKISKEEAEKMLDALEQQEKEVQEDLQKKKAKGVKLKIEKDW